jgi:precorrin-2 dehydrogenase / sirohydrochlorin ferrochelatase
MSFSYPIFLDITGKPCLVTGEGFEIPNKVVGLVRRGARVTYVHPTAHAAIRELADAGDIVWHARDFQPADLNDCFLVITDREDNATVFALAEERRVLCNAVDDPEYCRFSFGSLVSRGDLTLAISTNGIAPALAVRLRQRLERELGEEYAMLLTMLRELRPEISREIRDFDERKALWYRLVDSDALCLIRDGKIDDAWKLLSHLVHQAKQGQSPVVD